MPPDSGTCGAATRGDLVGCAGFYLEAVGLCKVKGLLAPSGAAIHGSPVGCASFYLEAVRFYKQESEPYNQLRSATSPLQGVLGYAEGDAK